MKIISGGQTGADRAALDAAIKLGLDYGGHIPHGRLAEDGPVDLERYPCLTELQEGGYLARTRKNVEDADATVAFTLGGLAGGTKKTVEIAQEFKKPYLHVNLKKVSVADAAEEIIGWFDVIKPRVLNVAGPRESGAPGVYAKVYEVLKMVFKQATGRWR